ncbi:dynein axonemal heavy chain 3-like [Hyalella azteca]|uniref:Dynein axonemal heavy chain 3-like n=1 Tax=Hyalella azteca TaxID=294128 RepID=A0A979FJA8_HYAAZ|nr:dynein axonemal heavy chain 3-like [Hyalella azteca]
MQEDVQLAESRLSHKRDLKEAALKARVLAFNQQLNVYLKELEDLKNRDNFSLKEIRVDTMRRNVDTLDKLSSQLKNAKAEMQLINEEQSLLSWETTKFPVLHQLLHQKEPYDSLWRTTYTFHTQHEVWYEGPFKGLDAEAISEETEAMWRTMIKLTKTFSDQIMSRRVAEYVKDRLERFRSHLPVLQCICNPGLRERHWRQLSDELGSELLLTVDTSLADMVDCGLATILRRLEEISHAASKEFALEKALHRMKTEWGAVQFEFKPWRETGALILASVEDIQALLDEHTQKAQTMRGSPYVRPFEGEIRAWEHKLLSMQDILDAWTACQVSWLYLEPIFASEDILKQMPVEGRKFTKVDATWRSLMEVASRSPLALEATAEEGLLETLQVANALLEEIHKGLNTYLEKKRLYFPRFFFLSNDELLEILSETKDPKRVQPHLRKCFEGIHSLHFSQHMEIEGMCSVEGELVQFSNRVIPAKARGLVERWLGEVEVMMVQSLQDVMVRAVESHSQLLHRDWLLRWPSQVVITVALVVWTTEVQNAIRCNTLNELRDVAQQRIEEVVQMIRGPLDTATRITLGAIIVTYVHGGYKSLTYKLIIGAIIVTYVHGRDVIDELIRKQVSDVGSFAWVCQLRLWWQQELVVVHMVYTSLLYGYEYLGNTSRLVVTPLTDRCFRTLLSAMRLCLGGAPEGPAGTGKTETCKDLAKAVAKLCVVFNCSEALDCRAMSKFFKGVAQSGAWACFDEFNRIELSVLSVVGQQVSCIQAAVSKKAHMFYFDGQEMKLNPTCAMFITMNPSYEGRKELPDNVKDVFRTVAMMVPDYAMIAKISLFSVGFVHAESLARKIVDTYRVCAAQLSTQHHYDYGMRAIKAVLTAAAALKLSSPEVPEAAIVLRALRDVNLPKFLAQDVPLFNAILHDLFPHDDPHADANTGLRDAILSTLAENKLQMVEEQLQKILQLHAMLKTLAGALNKTIVNEAVAAEDQDGASSVLFKVINPKALTLAQLYGAYDPFSQEWQDGVLSQTFRSMAATTKADSDDDSGSSQQLRWLVLDGPVDALWVESLNAALDDNKKLCLTSGELIQMPREMNILMETLTLDQASPATVSRCGVVFMEPHQLGWQPLKDSFIASLPAVITSSLRQALDDNVTWMMRCLLPFVTANCEVVVTSSQLGLFRNFCQLFDSLLDEIRESGKPLGKKITEEKINIYLQHLLVFAVTWSLGAAVIG